MNLHGLVSGAIGAINPFIPAVYRPSVGFTTADSGERTPAYGPPVDVMAQVQALTFKDLSQVDGLNLNGTQRAIYLYGTAAGIVRSLVKGGDLIDFTAAGNPGVWLVNLVLESWDDGASPSWVKVAVTLQND